VQINSANSWCKQGDTKNKRVETWREHGRKHGEGGERGKVAVRAESKSSWHLAFKSFSIASVVLTSLTSAFNWD